MIQKQPPWEGRRTPPPQPEKDSRTPSQCPAFAEPRGGFALAAITSRGQSEEKEASRAHPFRIQQLSVIICCAPAEKPLPLGSRAPGG